MPSARSYGWDDLRLGHGFRATAQGDRLRSAILLDAKVLDRLLELNHKRHAEKGGKDLYSVKRKRGRLRPAAGWNPVRERGVVLTMTSDACGPRPCRPSSTPQRPGHKGSSGPFQRSRGGSARSESSVGPLRGRNARAAEARKRPGSEHRRGIGRGRGRHVGRWRVRAPAGADRKHLSFLLRTDRRRLATCRTLKVTARWGRYERRDSEGSKDPKTGNPKKVWKRIPTEGTLAPIVLSEGPVKPRSPVANQPEVTVQGLIRRRGDVWIVTLFLVNGQSEPATAEGRSRGSSSLN